MKFEEAEDEGAHRFGRSAGSAALGHSMGVTSIGEKGDGPTMIHVHCVDVGDTILSVRDTGEYHLPPILGLHSLWLDGTMYDELAHAVAGRFRVIAPDFRGQGESAPASEDIVSMERCAADMIALVDKLDLRRVNVVASSMGGDVAARMVAARPELFASLTFLGSSVRDEPEEQGKQIAEWLDHAEANGFGGENLDVLTSVMFGRTSRENDELRNTVGHWRHKFEKTPPSLWPAIRGVLHRSSAVEALARIKIPTLIISGDEDVFRPIEWNKEMADGISGSRQEILKNVGHTPILEAPEQTIGMVVSFIEDAQSADHGAR